MRFPSKERFSNTLRVRLFFFILFFIFGVGNLNAADCERISSHLVGDYGKLQRGSGIWGIFERSSALKDKSVLGMQLDGKLRRIITIFENYCSEMPAKATVQLAKRISALIDEGRMLHNSPDRVPAKTFITNVQSLLLKTDKFLKSVGE